MYGSEFSLVFAVFDLLGMFIYIKCCLLTYLQKLLYLYSSPCSVAWWKFIRLSLQF